MQKSYKDLLDMQACVISSHECCSLAKVSRGLHKSKAGSAHEVDGRHVRVHCSCKFVSSGDDWTTPKEEDEGGAEGSSSIPIKRNSSSHISFDDCHCISSTASLEETYNRKDLS